MKLAFFSLIASLVLMMGAGVVVAQDRRDILRAPLPGLLPVHHSDDSGLELLVREQILAQKAKLLKAATPSTPRSALAEAYGLMGKIYHAYEIMEPAAECYRNAAALEPEKLEWRYLYARIQETQGRFYAAAEEYKKALGVGPDYDPAWIRLGDVYQELELFTLAAESYERALQLKRNQAAAVVGLGEVAIAKQQYQRAAKYFEQGIKAVPGANRLHYSLAIAFRGLGKVEKAKFHAERSGVVGVRPNDPIFDALDGLIRSVRLRVSRGRTAMRVKRLDDAIAEFSKALKLEPENVSVNMNLGAAYTQSGQGTPAIKAFESVLKVQPMHLNAHFNLATLRTLKGEHFLAIKHLKAILSQRPGDVQARFELGRALYRAELFRESLAEFEAVYAKQPDSEPVMVEMVKLYTKLNEEKKAVDLLEKSLTKFPSRGRSLASLSFLLSSANDTSIRNGKRSLELAVKVYNTTGSISHGILVVSALAETGKCADARKLVDALLDRPGIEKQPELNSKLLKEKNRLSGAKVCRP